MQQKNYRVINASAGSGKTYALVQNLLAICLKHPSQPEKIGNILALTFTNKAANEMKHWKIFIFGPKKFWIMFSITTLR